MSNPAKKNSVHRFSAEAVQLLKKYRKISKRLQEGPTDGSTQILERMKKIKQLQRIERKLEEEYGIDRTFWENKTLTTRD